MSKMQLSPFRDSGLFPASRWPDFFERFLSPGLMEAWNGDRWEPRVEVKDTPEAYVFTAEIPGLKAEDVKVTVTHESITISGKKEDRKEENEQDYYVRERSYGSFSRTFRFPTAVETDDVHAETHNGVLTVKVKKSKESRPRTIEVRGG